jgi:hypothetical protein
MTNHEILKTVSENELFIDFSGAQIELYMEIIKRNSPKLLGYAFQVALVAGREAAYRNIERHAGKSAGLAESTIEAFLRLSEGIEE